MSTAIRFDQVSKRFVLRRERSRSFQELALNLLHGRGNGRKEEFWALRDVSLEVRPGEMLGIIGPNGAGKSTVLKLVARIIEPTSGRIEVGGRVGALLELGAGFHPELTGRENIYLNGSILGLSRKQIRQQFDAIVEFSGIGSFIASPVKHYSSGMFMRLGFSIAVHVSPNILLVDEILAVGDFAFQEKCLAKIGELRQQGTTIIFVSHDLTAVRNLCDRVIWLDGGTVQAEGSPDAIVNEYVSRAKVQMATDADAHVQDRRTFSRWGTREVEINDVLFFDEQGQECHRFVTGESLEARISYHAHTRIERPLFGIAIHRSDGLHIAGPNVRTSGYDIPYVEGKGMLSLVIESLPLLKGCYELTASVHDYEGIYTYDHHDRAYIIEVVPGQTKQTLGSFFIPVHWRLCSEDDNGHNMPQDERLG
ncbi:MAG: ABC transporter ATP-binding protein [Chloroflexota bacterium]|nr:ABC transporter ATP-binding protein [Chloroflexota bacterium]